MRHFLPGACITAKITAKIPALHPQLCRLSNSSFGAVLKNGSAAGGGHLSRYLFAVLNNELEQRGAV